MIDPPNILPNKRNDIDMIDDNFPIIFSGSIINDAIVKIKEGNNCVVEGTDRIPRVIKDCSYNVNHTILISYKAQQPAIEKHEIKQ